jgi:tripartite-type tricarboxylate transporter receptor subunit TctC
METAMNLVRRGFCLAAACLMLLATTANTQEASYPSGTVKVIVPFSAGGTADIFGRMVAEHLNKTWGQPFVVENVGGAGGVLGVSQLARAEPDGQTLGLASTSSLAITPSLPGAKVPYRPLEDLAPIAQISIVPNVLVVNPERIGARTVPELIDHLKANPDTVTFGSAGVGTSQHLAGELFQQLTGTKMVHVPYKGSSQMVTDLIGGQIDLAFDNVPLLLPHVKAGKLNMLATATAERAAFDPSVPAVAEFVPGFEAVAWHGFLAPDGTPKPVLDKLSAEIQAFMRRPETVQKFQELGAVAVATSPEAFAEHIAAETERWQGVIAKAGIKAE